ncbi:hypothetical protein CCFV1_ORF037 [Cotesia congregata filamentous virus 1]|uniref:Uncharacterized protein n=1 Tax=Cotesia congregata filamentous virus 1 TaxID=3064291 RepID=A0ABC8QJL6_9VIRU|nr:hypothetical protein CCFV1_ORF037 [Cotesia congregata filamentous virus 1]
MNSTTAVAAAAAVQCLFGDGYFFDDPTLQNVWVLLYKNTYPYLYCLQIVGVLSYMGCSVGGVGKRLIDHIKMTKILKDTGVIEKPRRNQSV